MAGLIDGMEGLDMHLSRILPSKDGNEIISVSWTDDVNSSNWAEIDPAMITYLLNHRSIPISDLNVKKPIREVMDILSVDGQSRKVQVAALNIKRREALSKASSLFDAQKLGLLELSVDGNEVQCRVGRTSYFCSLVTNDIAAFQILNEHGHAMKEISPYKHFFPRIEDQGNFYLQPISADGKLSNHVGSMVLAVSADGHPVMATQKKAAMISAKRAVLSGSGSIEYSDLWHSGAHETQCLADAVRYGMARELLEETRGVDHNSIRTKDRNLIREYANCIQLAGYYRDLRRGGQPIFFGFCRMKENLSEIRKRMTTSTLGSNSAQEVEYNTEFDNVIIRDADSLEKFFADYYLKWGPTKLIRPSDQVLLLRELLKREDVAAHFNKMMT